MAIDGGSVAVRVGAIFDGRGFDRYSRAVKDARSEKDVSTKLGVVADTKGADRYDKAMRDVHSQDKETVKSQARVRTAFGTVWGGGGAAFAAAGGAYAFVKAGSAVVSTASDIEESLTKNQVLFGKYADDITKFSDTSAASFGISKKAALEYTGTFGNLFNALGITRKESASMSTDMIKLAADMASFNNSTPEEALEAMRSALVGETEPIRRFGVNMSDATLKTEAMKLATKGVVDSSKAHADVLDPQTKALAAQSLITRQTAAAHGDFARTQGGLANQTRILKARLTDMAGDLGKNVLPIVNRGVKGINDLLSGKIGGSGSGMKRVFGDTFGFIKRMVRENQGTLDSIQRTAKRVFDRVSDTVSDVGRSFKRVFGDSSGVGGDIRKIVSQVLKFGDAMFKVYDAVHKRYMPGLKQAFEGAFTVIRGVIRIISGILTGDFSKAWAGVKDVFNGGIKTVFGLLRAATAPIRTAGNAIWGGITSGARAAWDGAKSVMRDGTRFILGGVSGILGAVEDVVRAASKIPGVGSKFKGLANDLKSAKGDIDRYRESLKRADDEHKRAPGSVKKYSDNVQFLERRLRTLDKGTKEYRVTADELRNQQRKLNDAMRDANKDAKTGGKGIGGLAGAVGGLAQLAGEGAQGIGDDLSKALKALGVKAPSFNLSGAKNVGKGVGAVAGKIKSLLNFNMGGMVPAAVSSGELIVTPDGRASRVPGARTNADNVITSLPPGAMVFTDHGQQLLDQGASYAEAMLKQMPHFAAGGIVPIPGEPGESIHKSILPDVLALKRKYKLDITDGYAPTGHAAAGEHPKGLAIDAVPGAGGSWGLIDALAHWAEPQQGKPRSPFRWVGYTGDSGHGSGNHIHLSWNGAGNLKGALGGVASEIKARVLSGPAGPMLTLANTSLRRMAAGANKKLDAAYGTPSSGPSGPGVVKGHYSQKDMERLWQSQGGGDVKIAGAVGMAESGGDPGAGKHHPYHGLWQVGPGGSFDPVENARQGIAKWKAGGGNVDARWKPWEAYTGPDGVGSDGPFRKFMYRVGGMVPGVQSFRTGGSVRRPIAPGVSAATSRTIRSLRAMQTDRVEDYEAQASSVERLDLTYGQREREYNLSTEELVDENTGLVDKRAVQKRIGELNRLRIIRRDILRRFRVMQAIVRRVMASYRTMISRLQASLRHAKKKDRGGVRALIKTYTTRLNEWKGKASDLGFDAEDARLDYAELGNEVAEVAGTKSEPRDVENAATDSDLPGVELPSDALADDKGVAVGGDVAPETRPPSKKELAEAAAAQLRSFNESRADLFGSFGSNAVAAGANAFATEAGRAAGMRFYGGADTGTADKGVLAGAGGKQITQNITIKQAVPEPHTLTRGLLHEAEAAV